VIWWLAAVANVFGDQASSGIASSLLGDHLGFELQILAPHTQMCWSKPTVTPLPHKMLIAIAADASKTNKIKILTHI